MGCSTFTIKQNDDYILEVVGVDGKVLAKKANYRKTIDSRVTYQISSGEHTLTLLQYPKSYYQLKQSHFGPRASAKGREVVKEKYIHLNVLPNHHFQLEMIEKSEKAGIHINSFEKSTCKVSDEITAIGGDNRLIIDKEPLPKLLEQQLTLIQKQLYQFHQQSQTNEVNLIPINIDQYFGSILDDEYTQNNHIKVLSVLPFSIASSLGFKSGDLITQLGGETINPDKASSRELFETYIGNVKFEHTMKFDIIRGGKKMEIEGIKQVAIIPASFYHFNQTTTNQLQLVNNKMMDPQTTFSYQRQIIALYDYYKAKNLAADQIKLYRDKSISKDLGIQGKALKGQGLLIYTVTRMSPMEKIGLQSGDIIVKATNENILTDNITALISQARHWQEGQIITLLVNREDKLIELTGQFEATEIPAFTLTIDLKSHEYLSEMRKKLTTLQDGNWGPIYRHAYSSQFSSSFSSIKSRAASNAADNPKYK